LDSALSGFRSDLSILEALPAFAFEMLNGLYPTHFGKSKLGWPEAFFSLEVADAPPIDFCAFE
jgi:hypothetical protein